MCLTFQQNSDAGRQGHPSGALHMPKGYSSQDRLAFAVLAHQQQQQQQQHNSVDVMAAHEHPELLSSRQQQQQQQQQQGLGVDVSVALQTRSCSPSVQPQPDPDQHAFRAHHANHGQSHNAQRASSLPEQESSNPDISGVLKTQLESQSAQAAAEATAQAACRDYLALLDGTDEQQQQQRLQHQASAHPMPAPQPATRGMLASGMQNVHGTDSVSPAASPNAVAMQGEMACGLQLACAMPNSGHLKTRVDVKG